MKQFALDTVEGLRAALGEQTLEKLVVTLGSRCYVKAFLCDSFYCNRCCGYRRITITGHGHFDLEGVAYWGIRESFRLVSGFSTPVPSVFHYICSQCDAAWSVLVYPSRLGLQLAIFPVHTSGGVATPNTPEGVAYYLDQASRCHGVSANSAAITMFRSAVEWLLFDQGFTQDMLGPKIKALEEAIHNGTAPRWVNDTDPAFLKVIKDLGNTATHTNAGDLTKQDAMDADLYRKVELTLVELLDVIYEGPLKRAQRLADLKKAL